MSRKTFVCSLFVIAFVGLGFGQACSSANDCSKSTCSGDAPVTDSVKKTCEEARAGKCSSEFDAFSSCVKGKTKCDSSNKTDSTSAAEAIKACEAEGTKYFQCAGGAAQDSDSGSVEPTPTGEPAPSST